MKPNLVMVQPPHVCLDSVVEQICEELCDTHYVYLIRPNSTLRADSPGGVRFLNHSLDRLPGFGQVDMAIAVADPSVADRLKECYPGSKLAVWDPGGKGKLPELIASLLRSTTVVRCAFGEPQESKFAHAM
jgi:hypothetical protein